MRFKKNAALLVHSCTLLTVKRQNCLVHKDILYYQKDMVSHEITGSKSYHAKITAITFSKNLQCLNNYSCLKVGKNFGI